MGKLQFNPRTFISVNTVSALFSVFMLCIGCSSIKPAATKSGKHYFETFYVGADGNQYFIKPLSFKSRVTQEALFVDITFRYKDEVKDSARVNFSVKSPILYKTIDSVEIATTAAHVATSEGALLYNEKSDEAFISRFTTKIPLSEIKEMFDRDDWTFTVYHPTKTVTYKADKKTVKAIATLRQKVFMLM